MRWENGLFEIDTDPSKLDVSRIHAFLVRSYWAEGIPIETVRKSISNSLCFGLYEKQNDRLEQVGFGRVVSDYSTFAYLGDVYVEEKYRGKGLSKWLMSCITQHPELQGLRRFSLGTRDAHSLYEQFGFKRIAIPENWMEIRAQDLYKRKNE